MSEEQQLPENTPDTGESKQDTGESRGIQTTFGKGGIPTPPGKKFTSDNQPDPSKQKATKAKKRFTRQLMADLIEQKYKFGPDSAVKKQLVEAFGPKAASLTAAEIMVLKQVQKAILKADTPAFKAIMDQTIGLPKQALEHSGPDGQPIQTEGVTKITRVVIMHPATPKPNQASS